MRVLRASTTTLAVGYMALGIAALVLFAAPLYYAWVATIQAGRIEILQNDAMRLSEVFRREGADGLVSYMNARVGMQIPGERILLLTDQALKPLAGNLQSWPSTLPVAAGTYKITLGSHRGLDDVSIVEDQLPGGYRLLVGRDVSRFVPLERRFWWALATAIGILSVVGTIGGVLIRRALMTRIHGLGQTVSTIIREDLTRRLPLHRTGDELTTLSQTINGMLEQIEHLIGGVRNVSNAIAHDLRTPLAELRSRLEELSLTRPPMDQAYSEIDAAVADVDRVISIFNALLRLAEIDSGLRRSGFVSVELRDIAADAAEFYQPAAELKGVSLQLSSSGATQVRGDPVLLAQAIANLIDNALKYTPGPGSIRVSVRQEGEQGVELSVADSGPGIPDTEKPKVVERFYRGDASRATPGVGLGLSLVDAVARLHGSTLELQDNRPGLRVRMVLTQDTRPTPTASGVNTQGEYRHEPAYP